MTHTKHTIDASGDTLGRVASRAAKALMGKTSAQYARERDLGAHVTIANAKKLRVRESKRLQKVYTRYSGYPGGLKRETLGSLIGRKGNAAALRRAVERMLPKNTFRVARMKRLSITD